MTELKKIMDRLKAEDNLTVAQVLKMNSYDYHKELVARASKVLREQTKR